MDYPCFLLCRWDQDAGKEKQLTHRIIEEPIASGGGHVHGITHDPANDDGMNWLGLHYTEPNPRPG